MTSILFVTLAQYKLEGADSTRFPEREKLNGESIPNSENTGNNSAAS